MDGEIHTNGIESFWALLKPGSVGTYHKMNVKHLNPYVQEFAGHYNPRTPDQRAGVSRGQAAALCRSGGGMSPPTWLRLTRRMLFAGGDLQGGEITYYYIP